MPSAPASPPALFTLVVLTALSALSLNMFLPSLAKMAADFGADYALVALSVGGFLAISAVLTLVMGPLSDRFGRRPVLLAALAVFTLASLGCALSTNIWVFLAFRLLQGAVNAGWAVAIAVIRDVSPPQQAASRIGYVTMAMAVAPMLGPSIGGALDALFGWRASFVLFAGLGAAALVLCWFDLGETNKTPSKTFAAQFRSYPDLIASRRFWGYALCMAFSTGSFHSFLAGAPLVAVSLMGLSPAVLGLCMGSITAGFMLGGFLSGRLAARHALSAMMIAGRLVAGAGLILALILTASGILHPVAFFGAVAFVGLGNGLTMPSSNAGALSVRPRLAGSAAGLAGALTVGTGAVLSSLTGAIVTETSGAYALLGVMLFCTLMGLAAALAVRGLERRAKAPALPRRP